MALKSSSRLSKPKSAGAGPQRSAGKYHRRMLDSQIPSRTQGSIEAEVDGERILLSPKDFSYFGLTGTGAPVWDLIDGDRSVAAIVAELERQYEAAPDVIRNETEEFLDALASSGLVELREP